MFLLEKIMISAIFFPVEPYREKTGKKIPGIVTFHKNKEKFIRCDYCYKFPHIVKQYVPKRQPAITTENGTRFYEKILTEHLSSTYHEECAKAYRISKIEDDNVAPMNIAISKATKHQIDHIGKLMIFIYLDAKKLNLAANSWPSRYVAAEASNAYDSQNQRESIVPNNISLQYLNSHGHLNLMTAIVESHRHEFLRKINECLALSLRIDGSIDFTHLDKIYVLGKICCRQYFTN